MSQIRAFIKQFIPPVFFIIRDLFTKSWDFEYLPCEKLDIQGTYNSHDVAGQQELVYMSRLSKKFDYSSWGDLSIHNQDITLQYIISTLYLRKKLEGGGGRIRILDYGGSLGLNFHLAVEVLGDRVDYTIVELPEICKKGRKINPEVRFLEKMPNEEFDLIIMCAVLPYLPDWDSIISKMNTGYIYLAKVVLTDGEPFLVRQKLPGENYVVWRVLKKSDVLGTMTSLGYEIEREYLVNLLNPGKVRRIKNAPSYTYYGSWLFHRPTLIK